MNESKVYNLGNEINFVTDNPETINAIEAAETELLRKAEGNEDPKFKKYYDRIKNDPTFRTKKVVSYVLNRKKKDDK